MNDDTNYSDGAFPDELISAYLDGELSPAEKSRVEEQLMDSAEHRQLFEELKALRRGMQSLPKRRLDGDFAARVLERAEKQLLSDDEPTSDRQADAKPSPPSQIAAGKSEDRAAWRGLIWSVSAMAAAILLIVFSPWLTNDHNATNRPVAVNEAKEQNPETPVREEGQDRFAKQNGVANQVAADKVAASEEGSEREASQVAKYDAREMSNGRKMLQNGPPGNGLAGGDGPGVVERQAETRPAELNGGGNSARDDFQAVDGSGNADDSNEMANSIAAAPGQPSANSPPLNEMSANTGPSTFGGVTPAMSRFQNLQMDRQNRARGAGTAVTEHNYLASADQAAADMMVVSVDVTPAALEERFLDGMLQKHKIRTNHGSEQLAKASLSQTYDELEDVDRKLEKSKQGDTLGQAEDASAAPKADAAPAIDESSDQIEVDQLRAFQADAKQRGREVMQPADGFAERKMQGDVDVLVVVATPSQIDGLLNDMRSQSKYVLAMASDRPMAAKKRSRDLAFPSAEGVAENEEIKALADRIGNQRRKSNVAHDEALPNDSLRNEEETSAQPQSKDKELKNAEMLDVAGSPASERVDNVDLDAGETVRDAEKEKLEEFRGIARRLHLPEDFQKDLPFDQRTAGFANRDFKQTNPPVQGLAQQDGPEISGRRSQLPQGQGQGGGQGGSAGHVAANAATPARPVPQANRQEAEPQSVPIARDIAAKAQQEPLVRVLFVLRATGAPVPTETAETQPEELPSATAPANAALRESATEVEPPRTQSDD